MRPRVVGRERETRVAKSFELRAEIPRSSVEVLNGVPRVRHAKSPRGPRHQLPEALSTFWRQRTRIEGTLGPDKLCEKPGERHHIETSRPRPPTAGVSQSYVLCELCVGVIAFAAGDDAIPARFGFGIFTFRLSLTVDEDFAIRTEL